MRKKLLWLAILLLGITTISCSDDDTDLSASIGPRFENGKIFIGKIELPNDPVDIKSLPTQIQDIIDNGHEHFLLLEGTWKGKRAYLHDHLRYPYLPQYLLVEDDDISYYYRHKFEYYEVNWKEWKCIYHWKWYEKN